MSGALADLELLELRRQTVFSFDPSGRMVHETSPDRSRGRRFVLAGCREGNVAVVRDDVGDAAAEQLERLVAAEPPLWSADATPLGVADYLAALDVEGPAEEGNFGLVWVFDAPKTSGAGVELVWSGTEEADLLLARFAEAMPESLKAVGFREPSDIWEPWCIALADDTIDTDDTTGSIDAIASIAETVRRGPGGAEVGVDTAVACRGRGLAAAAVSGWSRHPDLRGLKLFYSTSRTNVSSQRVTERLGLDFLGSTFAVP